MDPLDLKQRLDRWFGHGDEEDLGAAVRVLSALMAPTGAVVRVIGEPAVDELRQEVIARLLARDGGRLREALVPAAYARRAWQNALHDALRRWIPRQATLREVARDAVQDVPVEQEADRRLDAERAIEIAASLEGKGRLAVLLVTRPDRISEAEWGELVRELPPPPPARPTVALDREEAATILFPSPDGRADARQQANSFDKAFRRAIERIRTAMGES